MQILMTEPAYERVRGRLATLAPDAEVVTIAVGETYALAGQPIDVDAVAPEIVWLTLDSFASGLTRPLLIGMGRGTLKPKWAQLFNAGLDNPAFKAVMAQGVRLTRSSSQAISIAEYVLAHALSLQFPIEAQAAFQEAHAWKPTPYREIGRSRWVLIGYGNIGREIARRIKPFGVDLTVVRRHPGDEEFADRSITQQDLASALPDADVVVLACALNDDTRGLCNADFFAAMKPGSILINIGRGGLVDEDALKAGLDRDQPGRAVLDVFATEPLPTDSWFWDHPKVRVSAHTSNSGDGNVGRGDELFLDNLSRYLAGHPLLNEADRSEVGL